MNDRIDAAREAIEECKRLVLEILEEHGCEIFIDEDEDIVISDYNGFYRELF